MGCVMSVIFQAMNGFDPIAYAAVTLFVSNGLDIQNIILAFAFTGLVIALKIFWRGKSYRQDYSNLEKVELEQRIH